MALLLPLPVSIVFKSNIVFYAAHDCEIHFIDFTEQIVASRDKPKSKKVVYKGSPVLNGHFITDDIYVGCGYDNAPMTFKRQSDGNWKFGGSLDQGFGKKKKAAITQDVFGGKTVFFEGFELAVDATLQANDTIHSNYINCSQPYVTDGDGNVKVLTTSDPNGSINYWDVSKL